MEPSQDCVDLIKKFEGCRLKAYVDSAGIITIGYGHVSSSCRLGDSITQAQADGYLKSDVNRIAEEISPYITVPVTQNQFDACVSFAYNVGPGKFRKSTLLAKINGGSPLAAADEFSQWTKAAGKALAGLVKRREAERELFLKES